MKALIILLLTTVSASAQTQGYHLQIVWNCTGNGCAMVCVKNNCKRETGVFANFGTGKLDDGTVILPPGVKPYQRIVYATKAQCEAEGEKWMAAEANQVGEGGLRPIKGTVCVATTSPPTP